MKKNFLLLFAFCVFISKYNAQTPVSFYASPNPCDSYSNIFFTTSQKDTLSLDVYNMAGDLKQNVFSGAVLPVGTYSVTYQTNNLTDGIYLLMLKINSKNNGAKLIKMQNVGLNNNTLLNNDVVVFPNPTNDKINLTYIGKTRFVLTDLTGKLVLEGLTLNNSIDISNFLNGTYNLQVYNENNKLIKNQKIIKLSK
jgi:hypothetical protein